MDIATIIGLLAGTGLVLSAIIIGGSALIFINVPGLLIVLGGTFATNFIKFSMKDVLSSMKVAMKAFLLKMQPADEVIEEMIKFTRIAKKEGLIALEKEAPADNFQPRPCAIFPMATMKGLSRIC